MKGREGSSIRWLAMPMHCYEILRGGKPAGCMSFDESFVRVSHRLPRLRLWSEAYEKSQCSDVCCLQCDGRKLE